MTSKRRQFWFLGDSTYDIWISRKILIRKQPSMKINIRVRPRPFFQHIALDYFSKVLS